MQIKLDDIELIKRIDKDDVMKEIRSVHNVSLNGRRSIVEIKIPGLKGSVFQDLGRDSITVKIDGKLIGPDSENTLEELRTKFESGEPIPLSTDIGILKEVAKVVIEDFGVQLLGGLPTAICYSMIVREYKAEKQSGEEDKGAPSQEAEAKQDVGDKTKGVYSESESGEEGTSGEESESGED